MVLAAGTDGDLGSQILYTVAPQYHPMAWLHGGERFPSGAQIYIADVGSDASGIDASGSHASKQARPLVPGFLATADASLSFDASGILFAGKKNSGDPWQVWEVKFAGGDPRQLTSGPDDHVRPFYLPDARMVYAHRHKGHFALEEVNINTRTKADANTNKTASISFLPGDYLPNAVLQDGRVLFSAAYPLGSANAAEIYTVYPDGSGVEAYRCDHAVTGTGIRGHARFAATQLSSGDIVFTHGNKLARFTSALAHEVPIDAPPGDYAGDIAETPQHDWLVASRPSASQPFTLHVWHPGEAVLRPAVSFSIKPAVSVNAGKGLNSIQPVVVATRTLQRRFPSALHDWRYANLLALDAHTSRDPMPATPIHSVRAFTLNDAGSQQLLGAAPVAIDGSFFVQVPGDRPIRFELLDASGRILRAQHGWMWARNGEQRICVGCHAGPEHAPENAVPEILNVSTTPADLTGTDSLHGGH